MVEVNVQKVKQTLKYIQSGSFNHSNSKPLVVVSIPV